MLIRSMPFSIVIISCLERGILDPALRELGFVPSSNSVPVSRVIRKRREPPGSSSELRGAHLVIPFNK